MPPADKERRKTKRSPRVPVVTRSTFWPAAGDFPYIDLEVKGTLTLMNVYKTLEYIRPTGKPRIWPNGPKAAKESGISLAVHKWEFWLLIDGGRGEISCYNAGSIGYLFQVYNADRDTRSSMRVTAKEALTIRRAVDAMLSEHKNLFRRGTTALYKPAHMVLAYPAESIQYVHKPDKKYAIRTDTMPKWPASQKDIEVYRN